MSDTAAKTTIILSLCIIVAVCSSTVTSNTSQKYTSTQADLTMTTPLGNIIWARSADIDASFTSRVANGKFNYVALEAGYVNADGTFSAYVNNGQVAAIKNALTAVNPNVKVLAWVYWNWDTNLGDSTTRNNAVNGLVNLVTSLGCDGFNDDIGEGYIGTDQNWVDYVNAAHALLKSVNSDYVSSACQGATIMDWRVSGGTEPFDFETIYSQLDIDFVCPMLYDSNNWDVETTLNQLNQVLTNSSVPVMSGLMVRPDTGEDPTASFASMLAGFPSNVLSNPKFKGFALWRYGYQDSNQLIDLMTSSDWSTWNNYTPKNSFYNGVSPSLIVPLVNHIHMLMRR